MVEEAQTPDYPEYWEADVVLRDGGTAHLRPIVPEDAEALQAFHVGQSESSIYLRFFTYKSKLSSRELARFTNVDYSNRVAFVITIASEIIGIGRYDRLDDPAEAEVAFNIADTHQSRGLGSILLEHLAGAVNQADYMTAVIGTDRSLWREGIGYFPPDTPLANDAGLEYLVVHGRGAPRAHHVLNVSIPGVDGEALLPVRRTLDVLRALTTSVAAEAAVVLVDGRRYRVRVEIEPDE